MTSDVLYYIVIIIADTVILCLRLPCYWMIIATNIVLALQAVLFAVCSKVWRKLRKPSAKALKECFLCGRDLFFGKVFTTVMNILFNSLASRLGTELYALNSICSSITTYMNYVILSIYDFLEAAHTILGMFPEFRIMTESDLDYAIQQLSPRRESTGQELGTRCVLVIRQIIQRQQKKGIPTIICLDFYSDVLDLARGADFNDHVLFVNLYDSTLGFINIDSERKTLSQIAADVQKEINKYLS